MISEYISSDTSKWMTFWDNTHTIYVMWIPIEWYIKVNEYSSLILILTMLTEYILSDT